MMSSSILRGLTWAGLILTVTAASSRAGNETVPPGSDLGRLQGRWTAQAGPRHRIQVVLEFHGRQVDALITTPKGLNVRAQGEVRIDETTSPRSLDWVKFTGPDQQEFPTILGIYKLDHDAFTVCNGGLHGERPTEFKPGEGVFAEVVTFHRTQAAPCPNPNRS
jgi:uncharacterized protein (TIGR03067 family)